MSGREAPTEMLAEVLAEHIPSWTDRGFACLKCDHVFVAGSAGSYSGFADPDEIKALIRAHVADVLASVVREMQAEALRDAATALGHIYQADSAGVTAAIRYLRDQAGRMTDDESEGDR